MFSNRLLNVLVIVALAVVIFFTAREGKATMALVNADRGYDQVEQVRAGRADENLQTDQSYDQVEVVRVQRDANSVAADRSYDGIEDIRSTRTYGK
jgi:hypothetical protein